MRAALGVVEQRRFGEVGQRQQAQFVVVGGPGFAADRTESADEALGKDSDDVAGEDVRQDADVEQ